MPTCRTCKYLDVKPDKLGRISPRRGLSYPCLAPDPPEPTLPAVAHKAWYRWPPSRWQPGPDDGKDCALYAEREKQA